MLLETGSVYYGQRKMDRESIKDQEIFYFPETTELLPGQKRIPIQ